MKEMTAEETKKWAEDRNAKLTPEELAQAASAKERFEVLETKGRLARVTGFVETPEVILGKMWNGFGDLIGFESMPGDMLDGALGVQAERLDNLCRFFLAREEKFSTPMNAMVAKNLADLHDRIEATRMKVLSGDRTELPSIREELMVLKEAVLDVWKEEDSKL